jgi:hypothetical protein
MPAPAVSTWPMITSSIVAGSTALSASTCLTAMAPSALELSSARPPMKRPIGVRRAATMWTGRVMW